MRLCISLCLLKFVCSPLFLSCKLTATPPILATSASVGSVVAPAPGETCSNPGGASSSSPPPAFFAAVDDDGLSSSSTSSAQLRPGEAAAAAAASDDAFGVPLIVARFTGGELREQ